MNSATLPLYRHFCCDVEICCSGSVVRAHKIILAANSGYFQGLFSFNKTNNEAKHLDRINLEVPWTSCMSSVESIINSFYGTRIILNPANIQSFIQAADFLLVPSVINLCKNFLQDYICRSTVVKTMELSRMYSLVEVEKACMFYILNNFSDVCEEEDFTEIPGSVLINLLEDTRLSATNEIFVLNAALRWIEACKDPAVQFLKVISKVRFLLLDETEYITVCDRCLEFANKYNIIPELHLFFREISELVWYKSGYESPRAEFLNPYFSIPRLG
ncbi:kelch-like protein 26 [Eurytemora carolleeae]|uniref:kelch-like protein 26 n=1 Tax=Eurytemora carolleeae TaxID=1294199 RepID=UPI000C775092|nr:kelch-like protein 26 [Eurytemora carolleeae]|eukprot:XP_023324022.1 kelch-like protein 26 [Eurytemora affinis]